MGVLSGINRLSGGSRVPRFVGIIISILLAMLVLIGTAAAGTLILPQQVARLTQVLSEGASNGVAQAANYYRQGLIDLAGAFGVGTQGEDTGGQAGRSGGSALESAKPKVYRPSASRATEPQASLYGNGVRDLGFVAQSGSVVGSTKGGSSDSAGTNEIQSEKKSADPNTPVAATPIPGAVWLLGAGMAGLAAAKRRFDSARTQRK